MGKSQSSVREFAFIGFLLLSVLFGMQIMAFIFGNLGEIDNFADITQTSTNETGILLNTSGFILSHAQQSNFTGNVVINEVWNTTTQVLLLSGNYTVDTATGNLTNASTSDFSSLNYSVNVTYTSTHKTDAEVTSDGVTNNSLNAINNYSSQAGTQFTTLGVAITLVVLVAVFLFFWIAFMGRGGVSGGSSGGGSVSAGKGSF